MSKKDESRRNGNFKEERHDGKKEEGQQPNLFDVGPFTSEDSTTNDYTDRQVETGKQRIREFWEWVSDSEQAWRDGIEHLLKLAEHRRYVSASGMFAFIREHDYVDSHGMKVQCNNNFGGIVNRVLIHEYPPLSGKVKPRASVYDVLDVMRGEQL